MIWNHPVETAIKTWLFGITVIEKVDSANRPYILVYFRTLNPNLPFGIGKPSILTLRYLFVGGANNANVWWFWGISPIIVHCLGWFFQYFSKMIKSSNIPVQITTFSSPWVCFSASNGNLYIRNIRNCWLKSRSFLHFASIFAEWWVNAWLVSCYFLTVGSIASPTFFFVHSLYSPYIVSIWLIHIYVVCVMFCRVMSLKPIRYT